MLFLFPARIFLPAAFGHCHIGVPSCEEFSFIWSVTLISSHSIDSRRPQPFLLPSSLKTVLLASAHRPCSPDPWSYLLLDVCWAVCSLIRSLVLLLDRRMTGFFDLLCLLLLMQCGMSLTFCCKDALLTHAQLPVDGNPQVLQSCLASQQPVMTSPAPSTGHKFVFVELLEAYFSSPSE